MVNLARSKNLFLMEALWTRFLPHYAKVREMIDEGKIGELKGVIANFGFLSTQGPDQRHFNPALGGGSLLDVGIYNVFLAQSILGKPDEVIASMTPASTGVDEQCAIIFKYKNGRMASLFSSFASNLETDADIFGTNGRIRLTNRFYEPTATIQYYPDQVDSRTLVPIEKEPGWGYQHEIRHVVDCLKNGLKESPVWGLDETLALMETLDKVRESMQLFYKIQ
jgi:predicted dehydrogenase